MQRTMRGRWRNIVMVLCIAASMPVVGGNAQQATAADGTFTIAVLPDTQHYVDWSGRASIFTQQTRWIAEHKQSNNIVFVSHEGDLVDGGAAHSAEWQRADQAMDVLDGVLPYSVVAGNHDYNRIGSRSSGASTYLNYFGPQRYRGRSWYGGASANKLNQFQIFPAGGWTFLHLGLELEAPNAAIAWAQSVIDAHPGMPTIITTHAYQNDTSGRTTRAEFQGNSGAQIWQKLIKPNSQIFMVLNGHFHDHDGERHQVSTNAAGQPVYEMVANYQQYANGGDGYMRLIQFDPAGKRISIKTYSPKLGTYKPDWDSQWSFAVDLYQRFDDSANAAMAANDDSTATPSADNEALPPTDAVTSTDALTPTEPLPDPAPDDALPTRMPFPPAPAEPQAVLSHAIWLPLVTRSAARVSG